MNRQIQDDALYEAIEKNTKQVKTMDETMGCICRLLIILNIVLLLILLKK